MYPSRAIGGLLCAVVSLVSVVSFAATTDVARGTATRSITAAETKRHVDALADDTFEGREAGSRGNRAAGGYIVDRIKKLGLAGGGPKGGYFQPFGQYRNILAIAEGSDPQLKRDVILVSGHYDHVGYGTRRNSYGPIGHIHNGADDNASGVAGLLEMMDALDQLPERPKRTILFAFWDGEEKGLLGSKHWIDYPTIDLSRVRLMINIDMIGRLRNDRVEVFGTRTAPGLRGLVSRQNDTESLLLDFNWDIRPDSDHHTFFSRSIPFLMMHTGTHEDYHRPSDDAEKVNNDGLQQITRLLFNVIIELADAPNVADFRAASRTESQSIQRSQLGGSPVPAGRLGVRWDEKKANDDGVIIVESVSPSSAADRAGIQAGDRFLTLAGRPIEGPDQFRLMVLAAHNPVAATVERVGAEEPIEVSLQLRGNPVRLGISWRTDDAEPKTVIVSRVVPGSAAFLAGVRVGDRIDRFDGQPFDDAEAFQQLATGATGPITLDVERRGRVRKLELPIVELDATPIAVNETLP